MSALLIAGSAIAGPVVAIVEEIEGVNSSMTVMSYLERDRKIALGRGGRIVIGYLESCLREEITGGQVLVGSEKSKVTGGTVKRTRVECDGGKLILTAEEAVKVGTQVYRDQPETSAGGPMRAALKIYSLQPIFRVEQAARIVSVQRADISGKPISMRVTNGTADMARTGAMLRRGALYRAWARERIILFRIDKFAKPGGPILSRLVIL